jgi:hypothetical protein
MSIIVVVRACIYHRARRVADQPMTRLIPSSDMTSPPPEPAEPAHDNRDVTLRSTALRLEIINYYIEPAQIFEFKTIRSRITHVA